LSLKDKTIKGLFWSGASQAGKQICQFVIIAILAHLLSPNDFGLLAMATVFINFGMIFSEMGISSALIQKQDTSDRHYNSAFWLNIVVGIALTLIFISVSPLIAWFYKKPELRVILTVISINYFISSFVIIQQTILTKEMDFKSLAIRDIIAIILSGAIGIFMAFHGFGVWSLVFQSITFTLLDAILLWFLSPWRPKYEFIKSDITDIFNFSANLTGFNILNYFARNIDQLLIGKILGAQALGYYSLAYKLMLYPLQNISMVIGKVMFPAFSKIQDDLKKVRNVYLKMVKAISLVTFPMMLGLFGVAAEFVNAFFGSRWLPIVILLRIFCICGMVQSIGTTIGNILLSQGRAELQLKMQIAGTFIVLVSVLIGLKWGINGVAIAYTLQSIIWVHITFYMTNKIINLGYKIFYSKLIPAYGIGIIILLVVSISKSMLNLSNALKLSVNILLGTIAYISCLFASKEIEFMNKTVKINFFI
jgi:PST family polysaccharide transporter